MLGFVGQFQHSLDAKGRLILPARFRAAFERGGSLSPNTEGCVALWTPSEFARQMDERLARAREGGAQERRVMRFWSANSSEVEFDKQGRFALPPRSATTPSSPARCSSWGRSTTSSCGTHRPTPRW